MTRQYPISASIDPVHATRSIAGILEPFGFQDIATDPAARTVTVTADPQVFQVVEGSILFLLGIRKWRMQ